MDIRTDRTGDSATITVSGSLNTVTASDLEAVVGEVLSGPDAAREVTFDFSDLDYIASAGLRVLMMAFKRTGGAMRVENPTDEVREVFDMTGLADMFGM